jgi:hypothetical protein
MSKDNECIHKLKRFFSNTSPTSKEDVMKEAEQLIESIHPNMEQSKIFLPKPNRCRLDIKEIMNSFFPGGINLENYIGKQCGFDKTETIRKRNVICGDKDTSMILKNLNNIEKVEIKLREQTKLSSMMKTKLLWSNYPNQQIVAVYISCMINHLAGSIETSTLPQKWVNICGPWNKELELVGKAFTEFTKEQKTYIAGAVWDVLSRKFAEYPVDTTCVVLPVNLTDMGGASFLEKTFYAIELPNLVTENICFLFVDENVNTIYYYNKDNEHLVDKIDLSKKLTLSITPTVFDKNFIMKCVKDLYNNQLKQKKGFYLNDIYDFFKQLKSQEKKQDTPIPVMKTTKKKQTKKKHKKQKHKKRKTRRITRRIKRKTKTKTGKRRTTRKRRRSR